ncbi:MAG: rRNA pseudouridine synthase [Clostridia bacterium]|nr:rRNA pseudouridine synthase [Clostridia bacterium]
MRMRVDRWLSTLGVCSRSEAKAMIRSGAVMINSRIVRDPGEEAETETDLLRVQGLEIDGRIQRHVMLHKPAGVLTAARDRKQKTVMDLLPEVYGAIGCMPVGRLDRDTTGLLIFSCDGEMNHRLLSPGRHVEKVYEARVQGRLAASDCRAFEAGLVLSDFTALPARLEILDAGSDTSLGRVTVQEGKFHQVKRMFNAVGHDVLELKRIRFGPLTLPPDLPEGAWRELREEELLALRRAAGMV